MLLELRTLDSFISVWTENRAVAVLLVGQSFNPLLWGGGAENKPSVSSDRPKSQAQLQSWLKYFSASEYQMLIYCWMHYLSCFSLLTATLLLPLGNPQPTSVLYSISIVSIVTSSFFLVPSCFKLWFSNMLILSWTCTSTLQPPIHCLKNSDLFVL